MKFRKVLSLFYRQYREYNELKEDRKVKDSLIKYLKELGHTVLDATPSDSTSTSSEDLYCGVNKAK